MKYGPLMIWIAIAWLVACNKTNSYNAHVLLYNASWSAPAIGAAWNGNTITTGALAQGQSSGTSFSPYLQVPAGTNLVTLKSGTAVLVDKNIYTTATNGSSFLFFDTSAAVASLAVLQLTDDLTLPDTAMLKYRVINASPDTAATADVWLVNGTTDSLRLDSALTFIGATATAAAVESFATPIKYHGEGYTIKFKKTGQEIILASVPDYFFAVRGIYSIVFSGLSTGTGSNGLKLSVLHHFTQ